MKWSDKCMLELTHHNLFENDEHRSRFRDLLECYAEAPFFTKGLCKCMYLSAWDNEHFAVMLDILNAMTINHQSNLDAMKDQGEIREAEAESGRMEDEDSPGIWKLSNAFLNNTPYDSSALGTLEIEDPDTAYLIKRALLTADVIDQIPGKEDRKIFT